MSQVKITLCLPWQVREQARAEENGDAIQKAIYDALNGQFCWAVVEYELAGGGMGCDSLHFRLEGLGLPSRVREGYDREPPAGITFEPHVTGALVPVATLSGDAPELGSFIAALRATEGPSDAGS